MSKEATENSTQQKPPQQQPRRLRPIGQRGYQPQSARPVDPLKLTPPRGGSSIQPPAQPKK